MLLKKIKWNCVAGEKQFNGLRSIPGPPPPPGGPGLAFYIIISHVVIITNAEYGNENEKIPSVLSHRAFYQS